MEVVALLIFLTTLGVTNYKVKIKYHQIDRTLDGFRKMSQLDGAISASWKRIHQYYNMIKTRQFNLQDFEYSNGLSGRINEGAFSSRLFFVDSEFPDGIHRGFEVDLEITAMIFSQSYNHCIQDIKEKPGFVQIFVQNRCQCLSCIPNSKSMANKKADLQDISSIDGYLQHQKLKRFAFKKISHMSNVDYLQGFKSVLAVLLDRPIHDISTSNRFEKITKATNAIGFNVNIGEDLIAKLSLDISYNVQLRWKPKVLQDWEKRNRSWSHLNEIEEELRYGYIIAKPSFVEKNNPNTTELRYSFAHLERKIVSLQSPHQRFIYLIFKSMFYRWIIPIDTDQISSYIAKTIMLWFCEDHPPDHPFWAQNTHQIVNVVRTLFDKLLKACHVHNLPYYFIAQINVLENITRNVTDHMSVAVERILSDVTASIPTETEIVNEILEKVQKIYYNLFDRFEEFDMYGVKSLITWRPDVLLFHGQWLFDKLENVHNAMHKGNINH